MISFVGWVSEVRALPNKLNTEHLSLLDEVQRNPLNKPKIHCVRHIAHPHPNPPPAAGFALQGREI